MSPTPIAAVTPPVGSILRAISTSRPYGVVLVHGDTGTGKTFIPAFYAPQPVHIYSFDGRSEDTVKQAMDAGRQVLLGDLPTPISSIKLPEDRIKKIAQDTVDLLAANLALSFREVERGNCRTIALDTGTELCDILELAASGRLDTKGDYGKSKHAVNRVWHSMMADARRCPCHFIVIARSKEIWSNQNPTGQFIPRGPAVMEESVDLTLQTVRERSVYGGAKFSIKVTNPKLNIAELGKTYTPDDWGPYGPFLWALLMQGKMVDVL